MKYKRSIIFAILILLLLTGCAGPAKRPQQKPLPEKDIKVYPQTAEQVKALANGVDGVDESTAVVINNNISAAVKVSRFDRLRLKKIKQRVHSSIKKQFPEHEIRVTSDKKLFAQLQQIEAQINEGKIKSLSKLEQQVNKINKDMKG